MKIRIAGIVPESYVDGPGVRMAIFVQGCPHHCPGCHNPATHDPRGGTVMDVRDILKQMRRNPLLDGITITGGEPFEQAAACAELANYAHRAGLNVWVYTGYRYDYLRHNRRATALLDETDVLVDGPYIQELRTLELPWRGSSNQRLIYLNDKVKPQNDEVKPMKE